MTATLDLNRRLATALGWTNIVDVGNALLGSPPWAIPHARGQCQVPNWAGCWKDCGPLMVRHAVSPPLPPPIIQSPMGHERMQYFDHDMAARFYVVATVIAKLEAAK